MSLGKIGSSISFHTNSFPVVMPASRVYYFYCGEYIVLSLLDTLQAKPVRC